MRTQKEKAIAFRELHEAEGTFIVPNPWDCGSARFLANMGFRALATTSAGLALSRGQRDGTIDRDATLRHIEELSACTDLPITADLGSGFGATPEAVAETVALAKEAGAVGCSIEDATGDPDDPIFDIAHATERVSAAVETIRSFDIPFVLTARAENFLYGKTDLADTIARLRSFEQAGADALYAPGLTRAADIAEILKQVERPVNVLVGSPGLSLTGEELRAMGVKRISVGSGLARAAYTAMLTAAEEILEQGTFHHLQDSLGLRVLEERLEAQSFQKSSASERRT